MPYNKTPTSRRINNRNVYFLDAVKVSKSTYNEYILKKALYIEPKTKEEIKKENEIIMKEWEADEAYNLEKKVERWKKEKIIKVEL